LLACLLKRMTNFINFLCNITKYKILVVILFYTMSTFNSIFYHDPTSSLSEIVSDLVHNSSACKSGNVKTNRGTFQRATKNSGNAFPFWVLITSMLLLTISNLILSLTLVNVLKIGKGIHGIELIPEEDIVKFYGDTDLDRVYLNSLNQINGFTDFPVTISGEGNQGSVHIQLGRNVPAYKRILVDKSGINFKGINIFDIKDPIKGSNIFTTQRPHYELTSEGWALTAKSISTSKITSSLSDRLEISSQGEINVKGSEGVLIDALSINLLGENYITLNASYGTTLIEPGKGIFIDIKKIPIVTSEFGLRTGTIQFKICVCMPQGNLFRIAVPRTHNGPKVSCSYYDKNENPCLTY